MLTLHYLASSSMSPLPPHLPKLVQHPMSFFQHTFHTFIHPRPIPMHHTYPHIKQSPFHLRRRHHNTRRPSRPRAWKSRKRPHHAFLLPLLQLLQLELETRNVLVLTGVAFSLGQRHGSATPPVRWHTSSASLTGHEVVTCGLADPVRVAQRVVRRIRGADVVQDWAGSEKVPGKGTKSKVRGWGPRWTEAL
jgi:hypothetical protein